MKSKINYSYFKVVIVGLLLLCVSLFVSCSKNDEKEMTDTKTYKKVETSNVVEEKEPLIVVMELAYPPFETKDVNGNPSGISVDFAKAFGESLGREVKIVNTAWEGLIPSLQTGKADMIISSMTITEARGEVVDFSLPYANSLLGILVNKDSKIEKAEDLNSKGMKIAVKAGSTGFIYAKANMTNAQIITLADESACVTEVSQGKADAFFYDQLTIYRNWQKHIDTTRAIFVPFQDTEKWGVAVKKGNEELLNQINDFIPEFTKNGGFDELSEKYLKEEKKAFEELGFKWFFDLT
ncbi:MAG: transporter substrate-binding domain-containing protein [Pleomorphochaeta sp.]